MNDLNIKVNKFIVYDLKLNSNKLFQILSLKFKNNLVSQSSIPIISHT